MTAIVEMDSVVGKSSLARIKTKTHSLGDPTPYISYLARRDEAALAHHTLCTVWDKVLDNMKDPEITSFGTASTKICFNGGYVHKPAMEYMTEFMNAYPDLPRFLYYAPMELHEPSMKRGSTIDADMVTALKAMMSAPGETIIVVMGDHGLGYGSWQSTKIGRLEEKMPTLYWVVPETLLSANPSMEKGFEANWNRLVTSYDQHQTLLSLLVFPNVWDHDNERGLQKGRELYTEMPEDRNCAVAHVPPEWCSCVEFQDASPEELSGSALVTLASMVVEEANAVIEANGGRSTTCSRLTLDKVVESARLMSEVLSDSSEGDTMLQLRFQTTALPSFGLTAEVFSVNLFAHFVHGGIFQVTDKVHEAYPISKFQCGSNYDDNLERFEQQGIIAAPRLDDMNQRVLWVRLYCVETWDPKVPAAATMSLRWIRPNGQIYEQAGPFSALHLPPPCFALNPCSQSLHNMLESWTSSWQSRTLPMSATSGGEGMWKAQIWQVVQFDEARYTDMVLGTADEPEGVGAWSEMM